MHEWALAESILLAAANAAKKEKLKKITEINVRLGELQQINKEIFQQALEDIVGLQEEISKDVKINIEIEETKLKCKICENEWTFDDMKKGLSADESESIHFIPEVAFVHRRCPKCKSPDFEILKGRGVSISTIKGEK